MISHLMNGRVTPHAERNHIIHTWGVVPPCIAHQIKMVQGQNALSVKP